MEHFLLTYGYSAFLPLSVLEGPIVTIVGAFFASKGYFNIYIIYLLALIGDMVGDMIYYSLGRYGGEGMVKRFGPRFGLTQEKLANVKAKYFDSKASLWNVITLSKVTHAPSSAILVLCGLLKIPIGTFIVITFINNVFKVLFFLLLGFYFGKYYKTIDTYIAHTWVVFIPIILLGIYLWYRKPSIQ